MVRWQDEWCTRTTNRCEWQKSKTKQHWITQSKSKTKKKIEKLMATTTTVCGEWRRWSTWKFVVVLEFNYLVNLIVLNVRLYSPITMRYGPYSCDATQKRTKFRYYRVFCSEGIQIVVFYKYKFQDLSNYNEGKILKFVN